MGKRSPTALPLVRARRRWRARGVAPYLLLAGAGGALGQLLHTWLGWPAWSGAAAMAMAGLGALLDRRWRLSLPQLCRQLDCRHPQLQDSSTLLLQRPGDLGPLARLQQRRTEEALARLQGVGALAGFHPGDRRAAVSATLLACLGTLLVAAPLPWPGAPDEGAAPAPAAAAADSRAGIAISAASTRVDPPGYTGLAATEQSLEVRAPENARVTWSVTLSAPAERLVMQAADRAIDFRAQGETPARRWRLERQLAESDFYQLAVTRDGQETLLPEIHNIEVTPDRAPEFAFTLPRDSLLPVGSNLAPDDATLAVDVSVSDDFRVADTTLVVTLASGNGENVRFRNQRLPLQPLEKEGDDKRLRYRFQVPVGRFAIEPGDELYWYLEARDNRAPAANVASSQHFILRWQQEEIFGLSDAEGMAIKVLPEYFRSQRQLIIDTEALLAEQPELEPAEFRRRSAALAHEQNLLRMRYGKFLGEEDSELEHGSGGHEGDHEGSHGEGGHEKSGQESGEHHGAGHDKSPASPARFGDATGIVAAVGHQHDNSEHATLFDPQTKELLRSALNAMWSSWRELSVVEPRASLPHQHRALRFIKEVQQASRIYLQRVGFEPPPVDEERRLTGERDEVTPPALDKAFHDRARAGLEATLRTLLAGDRPAAEALDALPGLPQLERQPAERLELAKALRRYRQDPACDRCRQELAAQLYRLLPEPAVAPALPGGAAPAGAFTEWLDETAPAEQGGTGS
ncbi:DUF4779 domain-containing protein [Microbulbifer yueqingensis]|uniref:DUF4175 domain-containing protein n=1 Tax=Microbulbifer yueqingensis TaxID=658219 RepID=A0A1G9C186_9GAMM|nr:DUF4779 domain-containing protein [Microbulbifer yueqingensis]SDK45440.1 hypothetical protein SAMN05216212_2440 [Microbulbifer yueqingensis]